MNFYILRSAVIFVAIQFVSVGLICWINFNQTVYAHYYYTFYCYLLVLNTKTKNFYERIELFGGIFLDETGGMAMWPAMTMAVGRAGGEFCDWKTVSGWNILPRAFIIMILVESSRDAILWTLFQWTTL